MSHTSIPIDYRNLFHHLPVAFIVFDVDDPHFTILEENEAHAHIAMVDREATIGKPVLEAFPDTSEDYVKHGRSELLESIRRVIKTGKPDAMPSLNYDLKDQEGTLQTRHWNVVHHPVKQGKKVVAVYQETTDITEKVLASHDLEDVQSRLRQVLQAGNIGTWTWDAKTRSIKGDANVAAFFGLDEDKVAAGVPGEAFSGAIHPDDQARVAREFGTLLTKAAHYESEYRTIDAQGNMHWLIVRGATEGVSDGAPRSSGIMIDITDRKRAEENLKFLTSATAQFSASLNYRTTLATIANMVVPKIADWCSIELIDGDHLQQVAIAHKDPEKVQWAKELRAKQGDPKLNDGSGAAQVVATGVPLHLSHVSEELIRATARDEEELNLLLELGFSSVVSVPMKLDHRVVGVLTLVSTESKFHYTAADVELAQTVANRAALAVYNATLYRQAKAELRERRKLQGELERFNTELETRVEQRTKQLQHTNAGLEREIRKRHAAERALDSYAKELARSNQELQDFAYVASHDLQEPLRKIQAFGDLLESELDENASEGGREYLDRMRSAASRMSTLIQDLLSFSRVSMHARPNTVVNLHKIAEEVVSDLEARIEDTKGRVEIGSLPSVWADATHMRQLLQNLIGNALKFHRPDEPPVVKVYAKRPKQSDKMYTIYVEDNGIGFDEKYVDKIFSVFQRLHGKEEYEGTGIGLAVCRKIAERYGGTITAASEKGSGSTFIFSIPISGKESHRE